jgi:hypothetical protein
MQASICPLTEKPFDLLYCVNQCRHYGGKFQQQLICYAYGGAMEISHYNRKQRSEKDWQNFN